MGSRISGRLDQPMLALEGLEGLVVIDEIRLRPELFGVLADREDLQLHPKLNRSITSAFELLRLDALKFGYPGNKRYPLSERSEA